MTLFFGILVCLLMVVAIVGIGLSIWLGPPLPPERPPERKADPTTVVCESCRHVIEKASAQSVIKYQDSYSTHLHFCKEHKVSYDRVRIQSRDHSSYCRRFYKENVEVDESGTPIGYVKKDLIDG